MALSADELALMRPWTGTALTDAELDAIYDRLGSLDSVVEEVLQTQLTQLIEQPSSLSLPSGLSVTITQNITALQQKIKDFKGNINLDEIAAGGSGGVGVTKLYRTDRR